MKLSFKNFAPAKMALALAAPGLLVAVAPTAVAAPAFDTSPAAAAYTGQGDTWQQSRYDRRYRDNYYGRRGFNGVRNDRGYYSGPSWRGRDGRYYCRRDDGTTGLLIGGAVGGLLGNEIAGRGGDRTLGTILGVAGGALLGREVDRSGSRCR